MPSVRALIIGLATSSLAVTGLAAGPAGGAAAPPTSAPGQTRATGTAPGAPGVSEDFLPADKSGFATATARASTAWLTVQKEGGLGEIFYPDLSTPSARALQFVVADRRGHATLLDDGSLVRTDLTDGRSLSYRQTFRAPDGRWRLSADYVNDPAGPAVLANLRLRGRGVDVYAIYDPALANTPNDDSGYTAGGRTLVAQDGTAASALTASPAPAAVSSGFRGTSDGITDLLADGRLDWRYDRAGAGNLVQVAQLAFAGRGAARHATLALGFGRDAAQASSTVHRSLRAGFGAVARAYRAGWHRYDARLGRLPTSLRGSNERDLYRVSVMTLAASEDKTYRGAYVASPTMPWVWGAEDPSGPYHLVWSRDLYQIATALIAAGDRAGASRALDYLFDVQQKADGSLPQNSRVDGTPVWGGLQLDEVALPIVLAHQLRRADAGTWGHVKRAADFLLGFAQDGQRAPWSPQDRWENQSGYSPATIASEIAGLVCAAVIARANGDGASSRRYLATADDWQAHLKAWTVTTTGPYSSGPYFLRLTKDGRPNAPTAYTIGDSGPANVDQRRVVDPSFLDVVRLGVLPANDPAVVNSLLVVDAQLGVPTDRGLYWHRASFDGYGEKRDGERWEFGLPDDSRITLGRAWPLLNGERGEYQLAAGSRTGAAQQLAAMTRAAGPGLMLPEQVWDTRAPAGRPGFTPGTPTLSATPLAWTHAQFVRLAADLAAGRVVERPEVVARRYGS